MKIFRNIFVVLFISQGLIAQEDTYASQIEALTNNAYQHLYSDKDSAYYYFDKIIAVATKEADWKKVMETYMSTNRIAGYHYDLQLMKVCLESLDSIFLEQDNYINNLHDGQLYRNSLLYDKGAYYFELDDFDRSRGYFQKLITSIEGSGGDSLGRESVDLLSTAYSFVAKMYNNESKYSLAKEFYSKNLRFIDIHKPEDKATVFINYSLLGEVYKREGNHAESNRYFLKALQYNLENQGNSNTIISTAQNVVQNYLGLSRIDSASHYLAVMKTHLPQGHPFLHRYHKTRGEFYRKNEVYDLALNEFTTALELLEKRWQGKKHEEIALLYHQIAQLHQQHNYWDEALNACELGIDQLCEKTPEETHHLLRDSNGATLLKLLKQKAEISVQYETHEGYNEVLKTTDQATKILDRLRPGFRSEKDKLLLIEDVFPLFESGLEAAYHLYTETLDKVYLEKAFLYAEKSKSVLLLEALLGARASKFANIPDAVLEKERQLKSKIIHLEKRMDRTKNRSATLEDEHFIIQNEYRLLTQNLETQYPAYYNLKYNTEVTSVSELQKRLHKQEGLVSYFYGSQAIYAMVIDANSLSLERIPLDTRIEELIRTSHKMFGDPTSDVNQLGAITFELYTRVLAPLLESSSHKKLIFLADGLLNYVPFGSLNTSENGIKYLIEDSQVSYAHSTSLLLELRERDTENTQVLAFAPGFNEASNSIENERSNLLPLPNSQTEVAQILQSFKGISKLNNEASLQNFISETPNYGILHLATHAVLNDVAPEYSYLAFSAIENQDHLLYVKDLYQLNLKAHLVVLSACQTGLGDLKRGEGFMGLSRGFFYSGTSGIVGTLWNINDASTSEIMGGFYSYLSKGESKDAALQKAKLDFLQSHRQTDLVHPYYWSGYTVTGNTQPIAGTITSLWYWMGGFFILAVILMRRKLRKLFKK